MGSSSRVCSQSPPASLICARCTNRYLSTPPSARSVGSASAAPPSCERAARRTSCAQELPAKSPPSASPRLPSRARASSSKVQADGWRCVCVSSVKKATVCAKEVSPPVGESTSSLSPTSMLEERSPGEQR